MTKQDQHANPNSRWHGEDVQRQADGQAERGADAAEGNVRITEQEAAAQATVVDKGQGPAGGERRARTPAEETQAAREAPETEEEALRRQAAIEDHEAVGPHGPKI